MSQQRTRKTRDPSAEDLEVQPSLSDSRLALSPVGGFYVEEWHTPREGMRYAVPIAVEAQGGKAVETWLARARGTHNGEEMRRKRPEWWGEERSLVPVTGEFRKLVRELAGTFGGFRAAERAIEANIARLPAGRHRARYRVSRKQLERIGGKSTRRFAQWRTLDALASIAPQLGVGSSHDWHAAIQSPYIGQGLGLYRSWCISQAPGQLMLRLPPQAKVLIQRYSKRWLGAGQESFRVAMAVRRSLEPLLVAYHAGLGIECSIDELLVDGPFELTHFIRRGLEREDILRAQRGTGRDRAERRYGGPTGFDSWSEAVHSTRDKVSRRMEDLRRLLDYLDFVEERTTPAQQPSQKR